ncbi:MAG: hypothetical protein Q7S60_01540 [bacterium]|nr:hypothetical protein [bacterium]
MRLQILDKLVVELEKEIKSELQVVFILSKIRKLLEWENAKDKYKTLNFYCNWVLHNKIDRTEPVGKILKDFVVNKADRYKLIFHEEFKKEFRKFLKDYNLPILSPIQMERFKNKLNKAVSEAPVEIVIGTRYRIKLGNPEVTNLNYVIIPLKE